MQMLSALAGRVLLVAPEGHECGAGHSDLDVVLEASSCLCGCVHSPPDAIRHLRNEPPVDLVLIAPGAALPTYLNLCRTVKFDVRSAFVPVIFAGADLKAGTVNRAITPYDVAPTLADYLGVKPPSGSIGNPLPEIVSD